VTTLYRRSVLVFGAVAIVLGVGIVARTAYEGGGIGFVFGLLFVALGVGRIYLLRRR
jgi:dipeptide/tripeptide permease